METKSLFKNVDCIEMYVSNLEEGIDYYKSLGCKLLWRNETSAGLKMSDDITEVMINTERKGMMVDFKVDSVEEAIPKIINSGGKIVYPMFDIPIGKCAVVKDKWDNKYVILDMTKGTYVADDNGNIIGLEKKQE